MANLIAGLAGLAGYKTYIACAGLVLVAVSQWIGGDHQAALKTIGEAAGLAGLRNALA